MWIEERLAKGHLSEEMRRALGIQRAAKARAGRRSRSGRRSTSSARPSGTYCAFPERLRARSRPTSNEGSLDGTAVFDPRTIRRATAEQSYYEFDWTLGAPLRWGLGLMLGGVSLFGRHTPHAFGHLGFTNILGWADPERRLGVAILTSGKPVISLGTWALGTAVFAIARTFPKRG